MNMRNRLLVIFSIVLLTSGCKKEEKAIIPRLKNCYINALQFTDDPRYFNIPEIRIDGSLIGSPGILFSYQNGKVSRSTGGLLMVGFGPLMLTDLPYDSLVYAANSVLVYSKPFSPYLVMQTEDPDSPTIYEYYKDGRLKAIIRRDQSAVHYSYQDDMIKEVNLNGGIDRNFYFENGNLIKITKKIELPDLNYYSLKEILFQDYDNNPNPFKGLFHLPGAFFRAFSVNNFTRIIINEYHSTDNVNFEQFYKSDCWYRPGYNEAGYPMFGEYE